MVTVEVRLNSRREPYLRIVARNGEILLVSETYSSDSGAFRAANRLRWRFLLARVVDKRRP